MMTLTEARRIAGSLSFPSKMPGTGYAIPASHCRIGSKLAKLPGTVCSGCYALKGRASYQQPNAVRGAQKRLDGLTHPDWVTAMVALLSHAHGKPTIRIDLGLVGVRRQAKGGSRYQWNETGFHRWHDSGDLQSIDHLRAICEVARLTPTIKHWLPTLEVGFVRALVDRGETIPSNLVIRLSSPMLDQPTFKNWPQISSVFSKSEPPQAHICPARHQDHRCGACRACWSADIQHIAYPVH